MIIHKEGFFFEQMPKELQPKSVAYLPTKEIKYTDGLSFVQGLFYDPQEVAEVQIEYLP